MPQPSPQELLSFLEGQFLLTAAQADAQSTCVMVMYAVGSRYEDAGTGGPDLIRKIYPVVAVVTTDGFRRAPDAEVGAVVEAIVAERHERPGG